MFSNQSTRQLPASSPYSDQVEEQNIVDTVERTHEDEVDDQRADQCLNHQRWTPRKTKGTKQTPKGLPDHWRYTPSIMDPKSYAFTSLANEASTYYTATPTGMGMLCHTQVPDLSTPGMNLNLLSPLSTPPASMQSAIDMNSCHHSFAPQAGNGVDAFIHPLAYGPSCFINPGLSYDPLHVENSPINGVNANKLIGLLPHGISLSTPGDNRTNPGSENFRFNVTLTGAFSASAHPSEDWTKISDLVERRRIQNRIAQRRCHIKFPRISYISRSSGVDDLKVSSQIFVSRLTIVTSPLPRPSTLVTHGRKLLLHEERYCHFSPPVCLVMHLKAQFSTSASLMTREAFPQLEANQSPAGDCILVGKGELPLQLMACTSPPAFANGSPMRNVNPAKVHSSTMNKQQDRGSPDSQKQYRGGQQREENDSDGENSHRNSRLQPQVETTRSRSPPRAAGH
ncbi:predicted protein [Histoplasma mississippiense (nom. inval.)]|uniref:predicted protein n=1 Tax=Ajellomyces capsulatus (strain NAm1 / WU24) TaxID=2059318 RepID=UPI000157BE14|nr:predicted protein [Histoplasma mississippiense (nom. inval.)]EDN06084.1 predicted protein [Histoplasma mississippiense (nom. inval.)]